jgi:methylglyoxal synthase
MIDDKRFSKKSIALVAHDNKKPAMLEWAKNNRILLSHMTIFATGTTGLLIEKTADLPVKCLLSGPLGGDQQIGTMIAKGDIDILIFFWDPLEQQPHDSDIKALLRIAALYNIPVACNQVTADYIINSSLLASNYIPVKPDFSAYTKRMTIESN